MNAVFLTLGFIAEFSVPFGLIAILLGVSATLATIGVALRNAPEGYETESGFHFKGTRRLVREPANLAMLRPHNAA